jgi:phosphoglycerol transferase MdoB-like AlkP superfamily enzyme
LKKTFPILYEFIVYSIYLLILNLFLRFFEYLFFIIIDAKPKTIFQLISTGLSFDLILISNLFCVAFVPLFLYSILSYRFAKLILTIGYLSIALLQIGLLAFFLTNHVLIDFTSIGFSYQDMIQIMVPELMSVHGIISILISLFIIYFLGSKINLKATTYSIKVNNILNILAIVFFTICIANWGNYSPNSRLINSTFDYHLSYNKILYSIQGFMNRKEEQKRMEFYCSNELNIKPQIALYHRFQPETKYTDTSFPLMHSTEQFNTLSPFFKTSSSPPNIVILICESLSKSISGPNAAYGSCTPFLDSLASQGLYWDHFLSNNPATEGVLPSIVASLPTGTREKFLERSYLNPNLKFNSISSILKQNGYKNSFYYPGNLGFSHMDDFLNRCQFDTLISEKNKTKSKQNWGITDRKLFENFIQNKKINSSATHNLDVLLTISMHSPFQDYKREELCSIVSCSFIGIKL